MTHLQLVVAALADAIKELDLARAARTIERRNDLARDKLRNVATAHIDASQQRVDVHAARERMIGRRRRARHHRRRVDRRCCCEQRVKSGRSGRIERCVHVKLDRVERGKSCSLKIEKKHTCETSHR